MNITDRNHAIRKIAQVGYYRLSGFWYPCRIPRNTTDNISIRTDNFRPGVRFEAIYDLYLFDKRLRLQIIDALERIEVFVRSVIAH